jgi:hypothetical protein
LGEVKLAVAGWDTPLTTMGAVAREVDDTGKGLGRTVVIENADGVPTEALGSSGKPNGVGVFEMLIVPEDGTETMRERPPVVL